MEENTKYGTSTVLLTSVTAEKGKSAEFEGFPCVSPLDDGTSNTRQIYMFVIVLFPKLAGPSEINFIKHEFLSTIFYFSSFAFLLSVRDLNILFCHVLNN